MLTVRRLEDGAELWAGPKAIAQPMAVDDGRLFIASSDSIQALAASNGAEQWQAQVGKITAPPLVRSGWVIVASVGRLTALRASDGAQVWQRDVGGVNQRSAIDGDRLYVPIADGRLLALELPSGKTVWEQTIGAAPTEPLAYGDRIYLGSDAKEFYCLTARRGEVDWSRSVGARVLGRAAADSARVYFAAMDNELRALDRISGALVWHKPVAFRPTEGPVLLGPYVTLVGLTAELPGFDAATGKPVGKLSLADPLATAPAFIVPGPAGALAAVASLTGGLARQWKLSLAASGVTASRAVPIVPLTVLPGQTVPVSR
jgi:outer membrane protein assembly factor BamB